MGALRIPILAAAMRSRKTYADRLLASAPLVYFPLSETSGATAVNYGTLASADGAYSGVELANASGPDGVSGAPYFDGVNDFVNIYSAALVGSFDGAEGTILLWLRDANWADASIRFGMVLLYNSDNRIIIAKTVAGNIRLRFNAGAVERVYDYSGLSGNGWFNFALTWSATNGKFITYKNGSNAQDLGAPGVWGGALDSTYCNIGCNLNTGPSNVWNGWLAHGAVWDRPLSSGEIAALAAV